MAEHSTVAISNGGKCESHSDIRWVRHRTNQKRKWAASSLKSYAKMFVAQFHQMSHIKPTLAPKTKRRTARHSSPRTPPAVPSDSTFLRLRRKRKAESRSDSAFHSQQLQKIMRQDFQRKRFELCSEIRTVGLYQNFVLKYFSS
jgi:hypothetical protein